MTSPAEPRLFSVHVYYRGERWVSTGRRGQRTTQRAFSSKVRLVVLAASSEAAGARARAWFAEAAAAQSAVILFGPGRFDAIAGTLEIDATGPGAADGGVSVVESKTPSDVVVL